jgi:glycosyl transferase family 25
LKIAVISRKDALERRSRIAKHLDTGTCQWFFVDASEGDPIQELPVRRDARRLKGRELPAGEIGCFNSHWLLWRSLMQSEDEWLCVLEDDVLLDLSFDFAQLAKSLEGVGAHYIRLHFLFLTPHKRLGRFGRRTIVRFTSTPLGTQAYLISRTAAKQFVRSITQIRTSIDEEMDRFWIHGIPVLGLFPFPTLEMGVPSTIFTRPFQRDRKTLPDIFFRQRFRMAERRKRLSSNLQLRHFDAQCRRTFPQQFKR